MLKKKKNLMRPSADIFCNFFEVINEESRNEG